MHTSLALLNEQVTSLHRGLVRSSLRRTWVSDRFKWMSDVLYIRRSILVPLVMRSFTHKNWREEAPALIDYPPLLGSKECVGSD
jgi:hypothetical protein